MCLQGVLDELELHLLAGVPVPGLDHLDVGAGHCLLKAPIARFNPARTGRPGEPRDLDRARSRGVRLRDVLARLVAHLAEGNERLGGELR